MVIYCNEFLQQQQKKKEVKNGKSTQVRESNLVFEHMVMQINVLSFEKVKNVEQRLSLLF